MTKVALIQELEKEHLKSDIPVFYVGDTVRVHLRIIEGDKERVQQFQGTVISRQGTGLSETFAIHRVVHGSGMERQFILHSPKVANLEVIRRGKVRKAKLYYLRGTSGKKAKVPELIGTKRSLITPKKKAAKVAAAPAVEAPVAEAKSENTES